MGALEAGSLYVTLGLEISDFQAGLATATARLTSFTQAAHQAATRASDGIQAAVTGLGRAGATGAAAAERIASSAGTTKTALDKLTAQVDQMEAGLRKVAGTEVAPRLDDAALQHALTDIAAVRTHLTDLAKVPTALQVKADTTFAKQEVGNLQSQLRTLVGPPPIDVKANVAPAENSFTRLRDSVHAFGQQANTALNHVTGEVQQLGTQLQKAETHSRNFWQGMKESAAGFLAAGLIQQVGSGLANAFGDTLGKASEFEQKMSAIKATTGETGAALNTLRQTALDLGMATGVGSVSAADAADAIFELGKAGVKVADINAGAAKATLQLAAAAGPEFGVANAAALAADSMNTFGLSAQDSTTIVNTLVGAANASSIGLSELKFSLAAVGPVAAQIGMNIQDFNVALAEFGMHGLKGSDAGTSLKTMLLNLQPTTKAAIAQFEKLGLVELDMSKATAFVTENGIKMTEAHGKWIVNGRAFASQMEAVNQGLYLAAGGHGVYTKATEKEQKAMDKLLNNTSLMNNLFFDQNGHVKSLADMQGVLASHTAGLTDAEKELAFKTMFGTDAIRAATVMAQEGAKGAASFTDAVKKQGDAATASATMSDNLKGKWEALTGTVDTIKIAIGSKLLPTLSGLTDGLNNVAGAFLNAFDSGNWAGVVTELDKGWRGLINAILPSQGPLAGFSSFLKDNFQAVLVGLAAVVAGVVIPALVGLAAPVVAAAAPFVALGVAVAALVAAFNNNFLGIKDVVTTVWAIAQPVFTAFKQAADTLISAFNRNGLQGVWEALPGAIGPVFNALAQFSSQLLTMVNQWGQQLINWIGPRIPGMLQAMREFVGRAGNWIVTEGVPLLWNTLTTLGGKLIEWIGPRIGPALGELASFLGQIGGWILTEGIPRLVGFLAGLAVRLVKWISDSAPGALMAIADFFNGIWSHIVSDVQPKAGQTFLDVAGSIIDGLIHGLANGAQALTDGVNKMVANFVDSFKAGMGIQSPSTVMLQMAGFIIDGLVNGIRNGANRVLQAAREMALQIPEPIRNALGIHSPSTVMAEVGSHITGGLTQGVTGALPQLLTGLAQLTAATQAMGVALIVSMQTTGISVGATLGTWPGLWRGAFTAINNAWDAVFGLGPGTLAYKIVGHDPASLLPALTAATQTLFALYVGNGGPWVTGLRRLEQNFSDALQSIQAVVRSEGHQIGVALGEGMIAGMNAMQGAVAAAGQALARAGAAGANTGTGTSSAGAAHAPTHAPGHAPIGVPGGPGGAGLPPIQLTGTLVVQERGGQRRTMDILSADLSYNQRAGVLA